MDERLGAATVRRHGRLHFGKAAGLRTSSTSLFIHTKNSIAAVHGPSRGEKTFILLQRTPNQKEAAQFLRKSPGRGSFPPAPSSVRACANAHARRGQASEPRRWAQAWGRRRRRDGRRIASRRARRSPCATSSTPCEYCANLVRDKIGDKYKDKIGMSEEQGAFQNVTAKSLRVLVSGLEQRLDAAMKDISRTNWSTFDMVGEESGYVRATHLTVQPFVVKVRKLIPLSYFCSFCDKFATAFALAYYQTLVGLKRISEAGTQQLPLDVYSIKTLLLKFPVMEAERKTALGSGGPPPAIITATPTSREAPRSHRQCTQRW